MEMSSSRYRLLSLLSYGIPVACMADGPSGIRMDCGQKATQIAIGTLLAATWNAELVEELYVMEGKGAQLRVLFGGSAYFWSVCRCMYPRYYDLYMVISNYGAETNAWEDNTLESLENGSLIRRELHRCAINICEFLMQAPVFSRKEQTADGSNRNS